MSKWTTEPPTQDGFYWEKSSEDDEPHIVKVRKDMGGSFSVLHAGNELDYPLDEYLFWFGPLSIPDFP